MLTWAEIDDLVTLNVRPQLRSYFTLDELEYKMRCSRESELLRYRSRHGLLDIGNVEATLFKQQFRFEKVSAVICRVTRHEQVEPLAHTGELNGLPRTAVSLTAISSHWSGFLNGSLACTSSSNAISTFSV